MANPALMQMLGYSSFEELAMRNLELDGSSPVRSQRVRADSRAAAKLKGYGEVAAARRNQHRGAGKRTRYPGSRQDGALL